MNRIRETSPVFAYQTALNKRWLKALISGASGIAATVTVGAYSLMVKLISPSGVSLYLSAALLSALPAVLFEKLDRFEL